jgi:hypothetical protein
LQSRLVLFCGAQNVEVKADDEAETIVEVLKGYSFWSSKVTQPQLNAKGFKEYTPEQGLGDDDVALLVEAGLEKEILLPKAKKGPPKK